MPEQRARGSKLLEGGEGQGGGQGGQGGQGD